MLQLTAGETVLTVLCDRFPARLRRYRVLITALFCVFSFVVSLPFATQVSDVMLCLVFRQPPESVQHAVAEGSEIAIALLGALPTQTKCVSRNPDEIIQLRMSKEMLNS